MPCGAAGDFAAICFADWDVVEPVSRLNHVLVGIVHRVQNAIRADFEDHVGQRLCAKIPARGDEEVVPQVLAYGQFYFWPNSGPGYAMIHAPDAEGQPFPKMTDDHLELRIFVKESTAHQPQRMNRSFGGKSPGRGH